MERRSDKIRCELQDSQSYSVVLYGLGAIGIGTGKAALKRKDLNIIGAVDVDESKAGRDLYELMELDGSSGVIVKKSLKEAIAEKRPDVVLQTTGSYLPQIYPQLVEIVSAGTNVISSAEELLYPHLRNPKLADELDALAKNKGVTVLGTGVNPGFVMDSLPLVLSGACQQVDRIEAERVVDVSTRREALQRKVGAGLTVSQFEQKLATGTFGHVGLAESLALVASGMGWGLDFIEETIEPVIAQEDMRAIGIEKGYVTGMRQVATGLKNEVEMIRLYLQISAGAGNPHDSVNIYGVPDLRVNISNGTAGGLATAAALVNSIPQVVNAQPGLAAMGNQIFPRYAPPVNVRVML